MASVELPNSECLHEDTVVKEQKGMFPVVLLVQCSTCDDKFLVKPLNDELVWERIGK